jgi:hypothetical protein
MNRAGKAAVATALTAVVVTFLVWRFPQIKQNVARRDSIAYWAAGTRLVRQQNPYDHAVVLQLEKQQGYGDQRPLVLRTPPWSMFMVVALGIATPFWAWVAWIGASLGCLVLGMRLCIKLYGNHIPANLLALAGYIFAPVPACLVSGQMGLALMLGIVLFLWWEPKRPFLAGAALLMPFAKPHLLFLFWVVFALWVISQKKREVAIGFLAAMAAATGLAITLDPHIFGQYREMLRTASIGNEFIPALSGVLRLLFFRRFFWAQFVPMFLGLLWCVLFFARNASSWDWRKHGPALLVVSVLVTPYEWLSDETVLLPAILQAVAWVYVARGSLKISAKIWIVVFALLDVLLLLILKAKVPFSTGIYFWSSLVWFFWYFQARKWYALSTARQFKNEPGTPASS